MTRSDPWFLLAQEAPGKPWQVVMRLTSLSDLIASLSLDLLPDHARLAVPAAEIDCSLKVIPYCQIARLKKVAFAEPGMSWPRWLTGGKALRTVASYWKLKRATKALKGSDRDA